jgi:hypothetical protein
VAFQYALNKVLEHPAAGLTARQAHQGSTAAQAGAVQQQGGITGGGGEVVYLCQRQALEQSHVVLAPGCTVDHPALQRINIRYMDSLPATRLLHAYLL